MTKRTPEPINTTTPQGIEVTIDPNQVLIGEEVIDMKNQVYKKIVALLIAEGHLRKGTKVEDVFAQSPEDFAATMQTIRTLIAENKIILGESGGPCNRTPDQAISYAEKLKPIMPHLGEAKCRLIDKLTLQHLQTLKGEALATACAQIAPFFTRSKALTSDETTRQISMIPADRFAALGVETIKRISPDALHEATILDEDKLKAIKTENIARMEEDTIRGIRQHLPVERITAIGGQNLIGVRCQAIELLSQLKDEIFKQFTPSELSNLLIEQLKAFITKFTAHKIKLLTIPVVCDPAVYMRSDVENMTDDELNKLRTATLEEIQRREEKKKRK